MRKLTVLLFATLLAGQATAQLDSWYGVDLGRIGYKHNSFKLNTISYPKYYFPGEDFGDSAKVSFGSIDLSAEVYGEFAYFFLDASMITDLIQLMVARKKWEERMTLDPVGRIDMVEAVPIRLAFGLPITKNLAIYAGGQYRYAVISSLDVGDGNTVHVGGNQRGAGGHLVYGTNHFLLRYSYMYDWIRRNKRYYKGHAITHEISLAIPFSQEAAVGLMIRAAHRFREMEDGYLIAPSDFNSQSDLTTYLPKQQASDFLLSIGIYMEGLFSGTTRTISNSTYKLYTE